MQSAPSAAEKSPGNQRTSQLGTGDHRARLTTMRRSVDIEIRPLFIRSVG